MLIYECYACHWSMSGPAWRDVPAVMFMATSLRDVGGETFVFVISNNNCRMRLPWKFFTTPSVYFISQYTVFILFLSSHWTGWSIDEACLHAGPSQSTHSVNLHTHSRGQNFTALPLYPTSVNGVVSNYITHMNLKKQKTWFNNL